MAYIGPYDMLIAAQAVARNLILVTNNTNKLIRIENLKFEDWKESRPIKSSRLLAVAADFYVAPLLR